LPCHKVFGDIFDAPSDLAEVPDSQVAFCFALIAATSGMSRSRRFALAEFAALVLSDAREFVLKRAKLNGRYMIGGWCRV